MPSEPQLVPEIDGLSASSVFAPESDRQVAELLHQAAIEGKGVAPVGGMSMTSLGNIPTRLDWLVSTTNLYQIIEYQPTDLTVSVQTGTTLGGLNRELAIHGQEIPIESPNPDRTTIGGLIATGLSGPRRTGNGTLRDLIIGIGAAHPDGSVSKAGGMVVKNVSGFDMMRLYHGSLGGLALITSVNLKVLPKPQSEVTLCSGPMNLTEALAIALTLRDSRFRPVAVELFQENGGWRTATRVQGRRALTELGAAEAGHLTGTALTSLESDESSAYWREYLVRYDLSDRGDEIVVRGTSRPRTIAELIETIAGQPNVSGISASPALGQVTATLKGGDVQGVAEWIIQNRRKGCSLQVLAAPPELKELIDVWSTDGENLDLMKTLKQEFDPAGVLNRGRLVGRL